MYFAEFTAAHNSRIRTSFATSHPRSPSDPIDRTDREAQVTLINPRGTRGTTPVSYSSTLVGASNAKPTLRLVQ